MCMYYDHYLFIWYSANLVERNNFFPRQNRLSLRRNIRYTFRVLSITFADSVQAKKYVLDVTQFKILPLRFCHGVCHS